MRNPLGVTIACGVLAAAGAFALAQSGGAAAVPVAMTPADGHTIHVLAPHVVQGTVTGPWHHFCKVISPEPVIECLIYLSTDSMARLMQIEYILAKTITRTDLISLDDWNRNWHDHTQEIATGRVQVLDLPPDAAKGVADLVATTDGIIYHLWDQDAKVPTGTVHIGQSVGHVNLTPAEKFQFPRPGGGE